MTGQCQSGECYVYVVRPDNSTIWLQPFVSRTLQATTLHPKCCHGLWHEHFLIDKAQQVIQVLSVLGTRRSGHAGGLWARASWRPGGRNLAAAAGRPRTELGALAASGRQRAVASMSIRQQRKQ